VLLVVVAVVLFVYRNRKRFARDANRMRRFFSAWKLDDESALCTLKGMSPARFEREVAEMFRGLGYDAEVTGGANDGGIDVIAHKDGKMDYIKCKKFITREVTPHDVRDFRGTITNVKNPADKGFFITTGGFAGMEKGGLGESAH
jgi:restriction endonuclease Mrr